MMRRMLAVIGSLFLVFFVVRPASAVTANVEDYNGTPLQGLTLGFTNPGTGVVKTVETNPYGRINLIFDSKEALHKGPNTVALAHGTWSCAVYREDELLVNQPNCIQVAQNGMVSIRNIQQVSDHHDPASLAEFAFKGKSLSGGASKPIMWKLDLPAHFGDTIWDSVDLAGAGTGGGNDASDSE